MGIAWTNGSWRKCETVGNKIQRSVVLRQVWRPVEYSMESNDELPLERSTKSKNSSYTLELEFLLVRCDGRRWSSSHHDPQRAILDVFGSVQLRLLPVDFKIRFAWHVEMIQQTHIQMLHCDTLFHILVPEMYSWSSSTTVHHTN